MQKFEALNATNNTLATLNSLREKVKKFGENKLTD